MGKASMDASEAAATIEAVAAYRERITSRAVGQIWVIWGMALAILALTDAFNVATQFLSLDRGASGWDNGIYTRYLGLLVLAGGYAAIVGTYMVWHGHTLADDEARTVPALVRAFGLYVAAMIVLAVFVAALDIIVLTPLMGGAIGDPAAGTALPIWAMLVAATITYRTRDRVKIWPGIVAVVAMWIAGWVFALAYDVGGNVLHGTDLANTAGSQAVWALLVFTSVGLWYHKRG